MSTGMDDLDLELDEMELVAAAAGYYYYNSITRQIRCASLPSGSGFMNEVLEGPDDLCREMFRMDKHVFHKLCYTLRHRGMLRDTAGVMIEEQLAIFLNIVGHNERNRVIQERFQHSGETISRHFNNVLKAIKSLSREFLQPPNINTPLEIHSSNRFFPYFKDCVGVIDGMHIPAHVPAKDQSRFRNSKGWEGSAADSRVLRAVLDDPDQNFPPISEGKYYLVDTCYSNMEGFLAPYPGIRYHLHEYRARFPILKLAPQYAFHIQRDIVIAACVLHNYIRREERHDWLFSSIEGVTVDELPNFDEQPELQFASSIQEQIASSLRESIATGQPSPPLPQPHITDFACMPLEMREIMANLPGSTETRHRLSASIEAIYKRRLNKNKVKDVDEKPFHLPLVQDRSSCCCKYPLLKLVLLLILCVTFVKLFYSPRHNHTHPSSPTSSRSNFVNKWIWGEADFRYVSDVDTNWDDVMKVVQKMDKKNNDYQGIGLLNFNDTEITHWKHLIPDANHMVLRLDHADMNVTWDSLYPEWIDEEQEEDVPVCPALPKIEVPGKRLDLIAVKLPCRNEGNWSRDVARLHLQLSAASLATSAKGFYPVHVLFVSKCFPIPNMFPCKELVGRQNNVWLYKPDLNVLRGKIQLPTGSCELALPIGIKASTYSGNASREAYATILHSAHVYVCGAIAAAQSIRMSGSTRDLVILVDETINVYYRSGLEAAGWKVRTIQRIRNPKAEKDAYNEYNYSKFRLWQLTEYDKIIFIDADLLILRNIDFLFGMPEISATGNNATLFNSGVMVIEPSNCTFQLLMDHIDVFESYNGGDQGYLNEVFTWWHRIPRHMNFLKHFWSGDKEDVKQKKTRLFGSDPPILYVLHYLGIKPWLCYKDYDCNWNADIMLEFASDVAHERWWKVHDAMPEKLQEFCLLRSKQKAQLEFDRREAEKANFSDGHWRMKVKDRRRKKCIDNVCQWESMLKHWGESNWTDDEFYVPTPPAINTASLSGL
ncbi:hypothetical protein V6N13_038840 [Hibiscus sabdariffa]